MSLFSMSCICTTIQEKIECSSILGHENYEKRFYHANAMSSLIFICLDIYLSSLFINSSLLFSHCVCAHE